MSTDSSEPRPVGGEPPRIALVSFGTVGDLRPFVLLAGALQQRGHRVRLVVPRLHEAMARASGLDWVAFGTPEQSMAVLDDPDLWHERRGFGVVWRGLLPSLDELHDRLEDLLRTGPCVVLSHPFLAPIVAMVRERRPELQGLTLLLVSGVQYLLVRSRRIRNFGGIDIALRVAAIGADPSVDHPIDEGHRVLAVLPFDHERQLASVLVEDASSGVQLVTK